MQIPLYQLDAFADRPFSGNPAAVCVLEQWLPVERMQAIAEENNLSETAFFVKARGDYELRWFTPAAEVDLCGHATLASAHLILSELEPDRDSVRFHTRSGVLSVCREGEGYLMDFPANPPQPCKRSVDLSQALGLKPQLILETRDHYVAVFDREDEIRGLDPDMSAVGRLDKWALIATAPGDAVDFVSRFFAPRKRVPEDPVTGSAHCVLAPYWSARLGKTELSARQLSQRGGELRCTLEGDRVGLWGMVAPYMRGVIEI